MFAVLHLSDIHFHSSMTFAAKRVQQIRAAIQGVSQDIHDLLVIISGDIAYSGLQTEYALAAEFVGELESDLKTIPHVEYRGMVLIPGNHDCDFENEGDDRPVLLSTLRDRVDRIDLTGASVVQITKVQDAFFDFDELVSRKKRVGAERLAWSAAFDCSLGSVVVRALNTAWVSRTKEQAGQLFFPVHALPESQKESALVITVLHHPYGWLNPENARALRRAIEKSTDIVLTGHEHDGEAYAKTSTIAGPINYVEGTALQARVATDTGFHIIKVDTVSQTYQVHMFGWQKDMYSAALVQSAMFTRNEALLEGQFANTPSFQAYLEEIGTPFTHPVKTQLRLSDLFVFPDLSVKTAVSSRSADKTVRGSNLPAYVLSKQRVYIAGQATSGKTSLAKALYGELRDRHKRVPVLIELDDLQHFRKDPFVVVERAFGRQYPAGLWERFRQLDPEKKVLIVDDWHRAKAGRAQKLAFADELSKAFEAVVFMVDDSSLLQQIDEGLISGPRADCDYCEIKQFGYRLRSELVSKWQALSDESGADELSAIQKLSAGEHLLDSLIVKGIVPAYPLFIFSVLQASDADSYNTSYGSFGHIYQALITSRIARVNAKNLGAKFKYLSLLGAYMFTEKRSAVSYSELKRVHQQYQQEFMTTVDQQTIVNELEQAGILQVSNDEIRFRYRYPYYFAVAQFFHDGISDAKNAEALRRELRAMADRAYNDADAYVLIFYLYLSKDRPLIEHILGNAERIFADIGVTDLASDVAFANALASPHRRIEAPATNSASEREAYLARKDEAAEQEDGHEETSETGAQQEIAFAFQSLNIMGQVLRNFPGDLKADLKLGLTQQSYTLGLRTLRDFLKAMAASVPEFQKQIIRYLRLYQTFARRPDEDLIAEAEKLIVSLTEMAVAGMIKKISASVGGEELKDVYEAVRVQAGEDHIPTRLIDLAITLDHFGRIPERDVEDLKNRLYGNPIVYSALRLLVAEFLYLFTIDFKTRQRMIKLLDFDPRLTGIAGEKRVKALPG